jgi:hypothetical protein
VMKAIDSILSLSDESGSDDSNAALAFLNDETDQANEFLKTYGKDFNSDALSGALALIPADLNAENIKSNDVVEKLKNIRSEFEKMQVKPIMAVASTQLSDTSVGEFSAKNFEEISNPLQDKQIYDLVATAYLADGSQISSKALRFSIDLGNVINKPTPTAIAGKAIGFKNLSIGGKELAQKAGQESQIVIEEKRPSITGETEFGSQVFAIWNSVVLASSVISDSERGAFEVQAPRDMETEVPHRVTLYAVKTDGSNKIRSDSVDVFFTIKKSGGGIMPIVVTITLVSLAVIAIFVARRQIRRRFIMKLFKK